MSVKKLAFVGAQN